MVSIRMHRHRFFVQPDQIAGQRVTLANEQARQIASVLRLRERDQIAVLDNSGWQYDVRLERVTTDYVTGAIVARSRAEREPAARLTLYQAMLKKDNFEWVLQKGTEIGVARFVPLITERSVVRQKDLKAAKAQRWQRIISEAAEQSGRGFLPELAAPMELDEALAAAREFDSALMPWVQERESGLVNQVKDLPETQEKVGPRIALFIGPEGGFSEEETARAQKAGVQPVSLGPRILRSETAAVVAAALTLSALGDL
jgi:16S rRNA (uracil1498-N3)-methyltransferase